MNAITRQALATSTAVTPSQQVLEWYSCWLYYERRRLMFGLWPDVDPDTVILCSGEAIRFHFPAPDEARPTTSPASRAFAMLEMVGADRHAIEAETAKLPKFRGAIIAEESVDFAALEAEFDRVAKQLDDVNERFFAALPPEDAPIEVTLTLLKSPAQNALGVQSEALHEQLVDLSERIRDAAPRSVADIAIKARVALHWGHRSDVWPKPGSLDFDWAREQTRLLLEEIAELA